MTSALLITRERSDRLRGTTGDEGHGPLLRHAHLGQRGDIQVRPRHMDGYGHVRGQGEMRGEREVEQRSAATSLYTYVHLLPFCVVVYL